MLQIRNVVFNYGTAFTTGLFLVSAVSGVALYFHLGVGVFRPMHETLSMVLLVPVVIHLWRNWRFLIAYFRQAAMPVALIVCAVAAGSYAFTVGNSATGTHRRGQSGGNPAFVLLESVQNTPLSLLAPAVALDETQALKRLAEAGFVGVTGEDTITALAKRSGRPALEIVGSLVRR